MPLVSLGVDWLILLIQKRCNQRSRDGKIDVRWVDNGHLTLVVSGTCFYGLVVRVGFDKTMDLIRVDVLQVVVVDLHPGVFQDFFR